MVQPQLLFVICITLFFFATSSIFCRMALIDGAIDAYSFTFFRLFFGVITLILLLWYKEKKLQLQWKTNWKSASMLFMYAICFSYAYINLDAGLGALILFAIVQLTLIINAIIHKELITLQKLFGIGLAFTGLIYLLYPKESFSLSLEHVALMILSGFAWGIYTILGKKTTHALYHTTDNFLKAMLLSLPLFFFIEKFTLSTYGIVLAFLSGGITSSLGYVLWYKILPQIAITTSGVIQLIVPVISIFLGIILLGEVLSTTLLLSTVAILLGILLCIYKSSSKNL